MDPISTLVDLVDQIDEMDTLQGWINLARNAAPKNQLVQLKLDRQQANLDARRAMVYLIMADIRNRN